MKHKKTKEENGKIIVGRFIQWNSTIKRNKLSVYSTWMNLIGTMVSESDQT